ncbi:hypothetical protein ACR780_20810 [Sphingobacterium faecium]|uniref:hypothetical protein n=1 Tax=Sphingobacterium faecium TaxID=34087 RepID=UPI003DA60556
MNEFENSFRGLKNIICSRKLYKNKVYIYSGAFILLFNLVFYFTKSFILDKDYYSILKIYVSTFLPALITFSGFTMTAYSLVVGFLNYGVFKSTIEQWYQIKIIAENQNSNEVIPKFSIYQHGIALFALAIITLLSTVLFFLIVKFFLELEIKSDCEFADNVNAIILTLATLSTNYCCILMIYNIVNIFTFSQSLNELVYIEEKNKFDLDERARFENERKNETDHNL